MNTALRAPKFVALLLLLSAAGCSRERIAMNEAPALEVPEFDPRNGLFLPDQTRESIGMRVVDVEERTVASFMDVSLQIYAADDRHARATGRLRTDHAEAVAPGDEILARLDDGTVLTGRVVRADGVLKEFSGSSEILVEFQQPAIPLPAGRFIDARIPQAPRAALTSVPSTALLTCSEGTFVYLANGRYFVRTRVEVGRSNAEFTGIEDGLYEGDQVVAEPVLSLWMTEIASVKGGQSCCPVSPEEP